MGNLFSSHDKAHLVKSDATENNKLQKVYHDLQQNRRDRKLLCSKCLLQSPSTHIFLDSFNFGTTVIYIFYIEKFCSEEITFQISFVLYPLHLFMRYWQDILTY